MSSHQFEIIINVLVSSFRFIRIPMLLVYGQYKYCYSYSAGIDFRRQILTTKVDPRAIRVKLLQSRRCLFDLNTIYLSSVKTENCFSNSSSK